MLELFDGFIVRTQSSLIPRLSMDGKSDEAHTNRIDPDD
jgi:hypothetical protein